MKTILKSIFDIGSRQDIRTGCAGGTPQFKGWLNLFFVVVSAFFLVSGCGVLKPIDNASVTRVALHKRAKRLQGFIMILMISSFPRPCR